jgi:hypothetical protein
MGTDRHLDDSTNSGSIVLSVVISDPDRSVKIVRCHGSCSPSTDRCVKGHKMVGDLSGCAIALFGAPEHGEVAHHAINAGDVPVDGRECRCTNVLGRLSTFRWYPQHGGEDKGTTRPSPRYEADTRLTRSAAFRRRYSRKSGASIRRPSSGSAANLCSSTASA